MTFSKATTRPIVLIETQLDHHLSVLANILHPLFKVTLINIIDIDIYNCIYILINLRYGYHTASSISNLYQILVLLFSYKNYLDTVLYWLALLFKELHNY